MYDLLAARALDADAPVPDAGPVAARLSAPSLADGLPAAAADALAALPDAFSITERVRIRAHHEFLCLFVGPGRVFKGLGLPASKSRDQDANQARGTARCLQHHKKGRGSHA